MYVKVPLLRAFRTSVSCWSFTWVWVIEGLLSSLGLSILADLSNLNGRFSLSFPIPPVSYLNIWRLLQGHQLQVVSPLPYFTAFSPLRQDPNICLSFHFFSFSLSGPLERYNRPDEKFFFLLIVDTRFGLLIRIRWSVCIWKPQNILYVSFSRFWFVHILFGSWSSFNLLLNSQWIVQGFISSIRLQLR